MYLTVRLNSASMKLTRVNQTTLPKSAVAAGSEELFGNHLPSVLIRQYKRKRVTDGKDRKDDAGRDFCGDWHFQDYHL